MPNETHRIKGRRASNTNQVNGIYPKFTLNKVTNQVEDYILSPSDLSAFPTNTMIYEPTEPGLGTLSNTMYVVNGRKTYLFHYTIDEEPTWGSYIVVFNDWMNFAGEVL